MAEEFINDIIAAEPAVTTVAPPDPATVKAPEKQEDAEASKATNVGGAHPIPAKTEEASGNELPGVKELAAQLGWREDHQGEDAVDAVTYILRSKDIQKSMSQHNKDLKEQLQTLNGSVEALKKHNETVYKAEVKKLEAEVAVLKKERKSAIELADVDKVEELDKQIDELQKDIAAPKVEEKKTSSTNDNPAYDVWIKDNQWYLKDDEMAKFADSVAQQYVGAPLDRLYKIVRTKVQEVFPDKFEVVKPASQVKSPIGPKSPVEGSSAKGNSATFTKADLTPAQINIMNQFARLNIMSEEAYINDVAKMQE